MAEANLIVTYETSHEGSAKTEVERALKAARKKAKFLKSAIEGLFLLRVSNPKKIVKSLSKLRKKKGMFQFTFYWVPVEKWVSSGVNTLQKEIKKLTAAVDKPKVDLEKPQKIIEVQIIGKKAGLALLNKDEILRI